ncbi:MAG: hypothetical protein ACK2TU_12275 [Anaerolineales bacterium]
MNKKVLYVILGLIVAVIVIAQCLSNPYIKTQAHQIEKKISYKIGRVMND